MNEFLKQLRKVLSNDLPEEEVDKNIEYYKNYFKQEKLKGRSEKDIINELGDPNLIATSIIEADKISGRSSYNFNYSNVEYTKDDEDNANKKNFTNVRENNIYNNFGCKSSCMKIAIIIALVAIVFIAILSTLFRFVFKFILFLLFGSPIALIFIILLVLVGLIISWKR